VLPLAYFPPFRSEDKHMPSALLQLLLLSSLFERLRQRGPAMSTL